MASNANPYLKYTNQGAIRNQEINPELISAMSFLNDMGIRMDVFSGGQSAKGSGGNRTGSTRHDDGGAADAKFYTSDGRQLLESNPQDKAILGKIVTQARANGVLGIGAGEGYMGDGSIHLGFGNAGTWGRGGKGANAPDWLRKAYDLGASGNLKSPIVMGYSPTHALPMRYGGLRTYGNNAQPLAPSADAQRVQQARRLPEVNPAMQPPKPKANPRSYTGATPTKDAKGHWSFANFADMINYNNPQTMNKPKPTQKVETAKVQPSTAGFNFWDLFKGKS